MDFAPAHRGLWLESSAVAANSTCRWSHFAYAISWRTSSSVCASLISGRHRFDDIWVDYEPARGIQDQNGSPLLREHVQCKWHVAPNTYGYAELVDVTSVNETTALTTLEFPVRN